MFIADDRGDGRGDGTGFTAISQEYFGRGGRRAGGQEGRRAGGQEGKRASSMCLRSLYVFESER